MLQLDGRQSRELSEALRDAFDHASLTRMLFYGLDRKLQDISLDSNMQTVVFELLMASRREGWTDRLILEARASTPDNPKLQVFAQKLGLALGEPSKRRLERTIRETNSQLDVATWRKRLAELEGRVCRVEISSALSLQYGTGFLVADDVVLTNYHVVEEVIDGTIEPSNVRLRFDYKRSEDGQVIHDGVVVRLDEDDWLIDSSPYHPLDSEETPPESERPEDHLDYALLRLDSEIGAESIGGSKDPGAPARGFIKIPSQPHVFADKQPLFILQHPEGDPLKIAFDTESVLSVNDNQTRVRYATNTLGGSSGSPCFDAGWQLVALHHSGDPKWEKGYHPKYNQGIPIAAVLALLEDRGKDEVLGEA